MVRHPVLLILSDGPKDQNGFSLKNMKRILTKTKVKAEDLIGNIVKNNDIWWLVLELSKDRKYYSWMYIKNYGSCECFKKNTGAMIQMTLNDIEDGNLELYIL